MGTGYDQGKSVSAGPLTPPVFSIWYTTTITGWVISGSTVALVCFVLPHHASCKYLFDWCTLFKTYPPGLCLALCRAYLKKHLSPPNSKVAPPTQMYLFFCRGFSFNPDLQWKNALNAFSSLFFWFQLEKHQLHCPPTQTLHTRAVTFNLDIVTQLNNKAEQ